jgi:hypothetical protein
MKMELGDRIKKTTEALGVKPCEGCKTRAEKLNELSRRGFMRTAVSAAIMAKNATLRSMWQVAGATVPIGVPEVLGFMRQVNTIERGWVERNGGNYVSAKRKPS